MTEGFTTLTTTIKIKPKYITLGNYDNFITLTGEIFNFSESGMKRLVDYKKTVGGRVVPTLNNLVNRSADSIGYASQFGAKGQLLRPYIEGITNKYKGKENVKYNKIIIFFIDFLML